MKSVFVVLAALALAGCNPTEGTPPKQKLPPLPADLVACFQKSGVDIPQRDLTVEDVERLWKSDRMRIVVMRNCGLRVTSWYGDLRSKWR